MTSVEILRNFSIDIPKNKVTQQFPTMVHILSVLNDKILTAYYNETHSHLITYSSIGFRLVNVTVKGYVTDATWTPKYNIMYILTKYSNGVEKFKKRVRPVIKISDTGQPIKSTEMMDPNSFTLSADDIIYLASHDSVFRSTDDGVSWRLNFKILPQWSHCLSVIKLTVNRSNDFWVLQSKSGTDRSLGVYSINEQLTYSNETWRVTSVPFLAGDLKTLMGNNVLTHDGGTNILFSDWRNGAIYLLSTIDLHFCQLLPATNISKMQQHLAVEGSQLYVGQMDGAVSVFKLTYEKQVTDRRLINRMNATFCFK